MPEISENPNKIKLSDEERVQRLIDEQNLTDTEARMVLEDEKKGIKTDIESLREARRQQAQQEIRRENLENTP